MENTDFSIFTSSVASLMQSTRDVVAKATSINAMQSLLPVDELIQAATELLELIAFSVKDDFIFHGKPNPSIMFSDWRQDVLGNPKQITSKETIKVFPRNTTFSHILVRISSSLHSWAYSLRRDLSFVHELETHVKGVSDAVEEKKQGLLNEEAFLEKIIDRQRDYNKVLLEDLQIYRQDRRKISYAIKQENRRILKKEKTLQKLKRQNVHLDRVLRKQYSSKRRKRRRIN